MPIPIGGLPAQTLSWTFFGLAVVFAVVAVIRIMTHSPWIVVAVPACLAIALGGAAWLRLLFRKPPGQPPKPHKLAGPGV